jgi:galactokinase
VADLRDDLLALFAASFGGAPDLITRAPGRVNLIGEHTDYNDGFVLPVAISRQTMVAAKARADRKIRLVAGDLQNATTEFDLSEIKADSSAAWSNYVRGMAAILGESGIDVPGADIAILGDTPQGVGLSSSAALEMASGLAFAALGRQPEVDRSRLAKIGQRTEHEFAGCKCGIMDQLVSACGRAGHALLLDCRSLETRHIAMPDDLAILIIDSGITRGLVDGEYNLRRAQCEAAAKHYGVAALRDLDIATLEAEQAGLDPAAFRRARHVVTENARTLEAAEALMAGDLKTMGQLMAASHASMCDDFQITLPPIDHLSDIARAAIGGEGGARMTGGGFGGAVVALCAKDRAEHVAASIRRDYGAETKILFEAACNGASILD